MNRPGQSAPALAVALGGAIIAVGCGGTAKPMPTASVPYDSMQDRTASVSYDSTQDRTTYESDNATRQIDAETRAATARIQRDLDNWNAYVRDHPAGSVGNPYDR